MGFAAIETTDRGLTAAISGGDRFRIFVGRSGRRHVFSRIETDLDAGDLDGAVVLVAGRDRTGRTSILRIGEASTVLRAPRPVETEVFAHWLTPTTAARRALIADLGGMEEAGRRPLVGARPLAA